jgi:hypothetical protein
MNNCWLCRFMRGAGLKPASTSLPSRPDLDGTGQSPPVFHGTDTPREDSPSGNRPDRRARGAGDNCGAGQAGRPSDLALEKRGYRRRRPNCTSLPTPPVSSVLRHQRPPPCMRPIEFGSGAARDLSIPESPDGAGRAKPTEMRPPSSVSIVCPPAFLRHSVP